MPSGKSIFKIIVILLVLCAYFLGPALLSPSKSLPINPATATNLTISNDTDSLSLKKDGNRWIYSSEESITPDQALVTNLLWHLSNAQLKPSNQSFSSNNISIKLTSPSGSTSLKLGQRIDAFKKQLIQLDDKTYEVNKDLNACIGFWQTKQKFDLKNQVSSNEAYNIKPETITELKYENILSKYTFKKSGSNWQLSSAPSYKIANNKMKSFLEKFCWMSTLSEPVNSKGKRLKKPFHLEFKTRENKTFTFKLSAPYGEGINKKSAVKMIKPSKRYFLISASTFHRIAPNISSLIENMPHLGFSPQDAKMVKTSRGSKSFTLSNKANKWVILKPKSNKKVVLAMNEEGKKELATNVYVKTLANIQSTQLFQKNSSAQKVMNKTAATIIVKLKNGKQLKLRLTPKIPGTSNSLLISGSKVLIVSDYLINTLAPEIKYFYTPIMM